MMFQCRSTFCLVLYVTAHKISTIRSLVGSCGGGNSQPGIAGETVGLACFQEPNEYKVTKRNTCTRLKYMFLGGMTILCILTY